MSNSVTSFGWVKWFQGKLAFYFLASLSIGLEIIGAKAATTTNSLYWLLRLQSKNNLDPVVKWPLNQNVKNIRNGEGNDNVSKVISELPEIKKMWLKCKNLKKLAFELTISTCVSGLSSFLLNWRKLRIVMWLMYTVNASLVSGRSSGKRKRSLTGPVFENNSQKLDK